MRFCILMGSIRMNGNTAELVKPFAAELERSGSEVSYITLADKNIKNCTGCCKCQHVEGSYGCVQEDDATDIIEEMIKSDCIVLATPIYSWYCTAPMKALLDRHYGLNKFYGKATGSLWVGKKLAILATHGYEKRYATEPFEEGIKRLCEHSRLKYLGMHTAKNEKGIRSFQTEEVIKGAIDFARTLLYNAI